LPFFGIDAAIVDPVTGQDIPEPNVDGVLVFKSPWPSMARTILGDHRRFQETYLSAYKGYYVS
jgi:acetyl-CoA synthetase